MRRLLRLWAALGFAIVAQPEPDSKEFELVLTSVTVHPEIRSTPQPPMVFEPCETMDPLRDPDDAYRIITYVSRQTRVPDDILFGIWKYESGEVEGDGGGGGGCNALQQLEIRCRVGHNCRHQQALLTLAEQFDWDLETLQGSCGRSTMKSNKGIFGGCIGPMQISTGEWLQREKYEDKNPLNLCWSMMETGERLRRYYNRKVRHGTFEDEAWSWAIRRYHGSPDAPVSFYYLSKVNLWRSSYQRHSPKWFMRFHARLSADKRQSLLAANAP